MDTNVFQINIYDFPELSTLYSVQINQIMREISLLYDLENPPISLKFPVEVPKAGLICSNFYWRILPISGEIQIQVKNKENDEKK